MAHNLFPEALQNVWSMQSDVTETTVDGTMNFKKPVTVSSMSSAGVGVFGSVTSRGSGIFSDISCTGSVDCASIHCKNNGALSSFLGYVEIFSTAVSASSLYCYVNKAYQAGVEVTNITSTNPRGILVNIPAASANGDNAIMTFLGDTSSETYGHLRCYSFDGDITDFRLMANGQAYARGSWNAGGADVAEIHRWNPDKRDNTPGTTIVLDEDMPGRVRYSTAGDLAVNIIGVISSDPGVLMGNSPNDPDKFLKTNDGEFVRDENGKRVRDPNYVGPPMVGNPPVSTYKPKSEYPNKYAVVGYLGKLHVRKGQVVGDRWKLMKVGVNRDLYLVR